MTQAQLLIGIDGGGTSCRAVLRAGQGEVRLSGGSANVSDFTAAIGTIRALVLRLAESAGVGADALAGAALHLGLAGVTGPAMAERVRQALSDLVPGGRISVSGDDVTTIAGALGARDGSVAGIGTGSFVGRQAGGHITSLGGHGFLLGDDASGAWLGRALLRHILLAEDGIEPHSDLTRAVFADHDGDRAALIAFAIAARPAEFARLAPRIATAANAGDPVAEPLMGEGAHYIVRALKALGGAGQGVLCLTGGLGPFYRPFLPDPIAARIAAPEGSALDGALTLAARGGTP